MLANNISDFFISQGVYLLFYILFYNPLKEDENKKKIYSISDAEPRIN